MVYRLRADLFCDNLSDIIALQDVIKPYFPKVRNVLVEKSTVTVHDCGHDTDPPTPCTDILFSWEKVT